MASQVRNVFGAFEKRAPGSRKPFAQDKKQQQFQPTGRNDAK